MKFKRLKELLSEVYVAGYPVNEPEIIDENPANAHDVGYRTKMLVRNNPEAFTVKHFEENGKWYVVVYDKGENHEMVRRQFPNKELSDIYMKSELNM